MRIDIKSVKGNCYLQYVDKNGLLHHLGSAYDFDSWLVGLFVWYKEYTEKRRDLVETMKTKVGEFIKLDAEREAIIESLFWGSSDRRRMHIPHNHPFYRHLRASNSEKIVSVPTELGKRLQKQLDAISAKQKSHQRQE